MALERSVNKFTMLPVGQYDGYARLGELVVDITVPSMPALYVGNVSGNVIPVSGGGGGGSPGGLPGQIQFNSGGAFGGSPALTFDGANMTVGGNVTATNFIGNFAGNIGDITSTITGNTVTAAGNVTGGNLVTGGNVYANSGNVYANGVYANVMTANGNVTGGNLVTGGNVYANSGNVYANGVYSNVVTANGNVTGGNIVTGGSVYANSGNVYANGVYANTGNFVNLNVSGEANLGSVGNLYIGGGSNGQVLTTDGAGNLSWTTVSSGSSYGDSNVTSLLSALGSNSISTTGNLTGNVVTASTFTTSGANANIVLAPTGTGNVTLSPQTYITNLKDPLNSQDAATKYYVDALAQGLKPKAAVDIATTGDIGGTYDNGTLGVGATLTFGTPLGAIDGVTPTVGMRILLKDQATPAQNGIYDVTSTTVLTRSADYDVAAEMVSGVFAFCSGGTVNKSIGFVQTSDDVTTVGTDTISFTPQSAAISYVAGTGLSLSGTTFSVNASQTQVTSVGTLTGLTVGGLSNLGPVGNVTITGGTSGQFLKTDGSGGLSWDNAGVTVPGSDTQVIFNDGGNLGADAGLTYNKTTDTLSPINLSVSGTANFYTTSTNAVTNPAMIVQNGEELVKVTGTGAAGVINFDCQNAVQMITADATNNWTTNFRYNANTALANVLVYDAANGISGSMTVVHMVKIGAATRYASAFQVDGVSVTPIWQGGTAPTAGNANGYDVYSYTLVRVGASSYTVLASQTQFK